MDLAEEGRSFPVFCSVAASAFSVCFCSASVGAGFVSVRGGIALPSCAGVSALGEAQVLWAGGRPVVAVFCGVFARFCEVSANSGEVSVRSRGVSAGSRSVVTCSDGEFPDPSSDSACVERDCAWPGPRDPEVPKGGQTRDYPGGDEPWREEGEGGGLRLLGGGGGST